MNQHGNLMSLVNPSCGATTLSSGLSATFSPCLGEKGRWRELSLQRAEVRDRSQLQGTQP